MMVKEELIKRSPLRILEKSIHGGVGKGHIGVLASRKGVGKTACLVHIATDKLFQGKHVIHVSFSSRVNHIVSWYEDIFSEIAKKRNLENAVEIHDAIIKNRVIMNFNQEGVKTTSILKSLEAMITDGHFEADAVVVDGFDFTKASVEDLDSLKEFAAKLNLEIWFSATLKRENLGKAENGVPVELKDFIGSLEVVISLEPDGDHVKLTLVKDHDDQEVKDMHLMLEPNTLLIAED
jgi:hypothetical protein